MKRILSVTGSVVVLGLALFAVWVPLPYYSEGPGPAREVGPLIHVDGLERYASSGKLVMTTVSQRGELTTLQLLFAWLDTDTRILSRDEVLPPGTSAEQEQQRAYSQMDTSKIDATYVALYRLTSYPIEHGSGALVEGIVAGCPAEGELAAGDVIEEIAGEPIDSQAEASELLGSQPVGRAFDVTITAAGEEHTYSLARERCAEGFGPLLGVSLVDTFPYDISIESGDVGGPSAGLMYALGLYDLLTPGDITGGRTIAGTGTIDRLGSVGAIGGVGDKVVAAERAGADVFLVPLGNYGEAQAAVNGSIELVPVSSFEEAIAYLNQAATLSP